jgi:predicted PurR-regulated permease PerM
LAKHSPALPWQRALIVLTATVVGVVVVGTLYWAQTVFIPVALAAYLTFLLSIPVKALQRRGVGRIPSVLLVVLMAAVVLGGLGWVAASQVSGLLKELPDYTANVTRKIQSVRELGEGTGRLQRMVHDVIGQVQGKPAGQDEGLPPAAPGATSAAAGAPGEAAPSQTPSWMDRLPGYLSPAAESLGVLAFALVLVIFMLLKREDLRNRFIRLVGHGQLTGTTKAVDEAGQRISRYLLMQLVINGTFGVVLAVALTLIGVRHALLWGLMAAVLRYIPYVGAWVAAALLLTLSLAMFPGWWPALAVFAVILVLELVTANAVEPWLFGHTLGVSEVALLVAAALGAFLWGPVGLVLSGPLTVCLVVLGRYVPQLQFFDVLLGDEPALEADVTYYQRLLARDQDEAAALVLARTKEPIPELVYDELLVPALTYAKRDRERDELTEADEQFVLRATAEILEDLGERRAGAETGGPAATMTSGTDKVRILGCPGHDEADARALGMLGQLLDPTRWEMDVLSTEMLSAEMVALAGEKMPAVVCIGALPPGGLAHTRYLCKRLRARLPAARIVVGRWGLRGNVDLNQEQLREAGADQVDTTLRDTRDYLVASLSVLANAAA